jgi:hypothetical protein
MCPPLSISLQNKKYQRIAGNATLWPEGSLTVHVSAENNNLGFVA